MSTGEVKYQTVTQELSNHALKAFISCEKKEIPPKIIQDALTNIKNTPLSAVTKQEVLERIYSAEKYRESHPILHLINSVFQHIMGQETSDYLLETLKAELGSFSNEDVKEALTFYGKEIATSAQESLAFLNTILVSGNYTVEQLASLKQTGKVPKGLVEELETIATASETADVGAAVLNGGTTEPESATSESSAKGFFQKTISWITESVDLNKYTSIFRTTVSAPPQEQPKSQLSTEKFETPVDVIQKYKDALQLLAANKPIEDTDITTELKNCVGGFPKLPKLTKAILRENSFTMIGRRNKTVLDLLKICRVKKGHSNSINLYENYYYDPKRIDIVMRTLLHEEHYDVFEGMAMLRYQPSSSFVSTGVISADSQNHDLNTIKMAIETFKAFKKNPTADTLKVVIFIEERTEVAPLFELIKKEALRFVSENEEATKAAEALLKEKEVDIALILEGQISSSTSPKEYESIKTKRIKNLRLSIQVSETDKTPNFTPTENLIRLVSILKRTVVEKKELEEAIGQTSEELTVPDQSALVFIEKYQAELTKQIKTITKQQSTAETIRTLKTALVEKKQLAPFLGKTYEASDQDIQAEKLIQDYNIELLTNRLENPKPEESTELMLNLKRALKEKEKLLESLEMTYIASDIDANALKALEDYKQEFITRKDTLITTIINSIKPGKEQAQTIGQLQRALNDKKEFFKLIDEEYTPSDKDIEAEALIQPHNDRQSRPRDFN